MSITDIAPAPTTPRKAAKPRKAKKPVAAASPPVPAEFEGMTTTACCSKCSAAGCVISGSVYCAHPRKGGLQGRDMGDSEKLARLQRAQKHLGKKDLDKRYA